MHPRKRVMRKPRSGGVRSQEPAAWSEPSYVGRLALMSRWETKVPRTAGIVGLCNEVAAPGRKREGGAERQAGKSTAARVDAKESREMVGNRLVDESV